MEEAERINSRNAEQVVSLKYGFIPRGSYIHTTKHCNILSVTYNSKKNQYVILDSRGVSTWSKSNKYNYFNRLKDFDASEFNSLLSVTYSKAANLYICLTRDYDIKFCNMGFIEVLLIDLDGTTLPKVAYDSKNNEIVVISRKKVQFWKITINDANRVNEGSRLLREFDVPSTSLVTNAEYDDEYKFIYLISHNMIWCYDADLINFAQFDHPKIACSSFKTCTYFKRTNVFAAGMSTGEIPIYSYSGGLIQTLRKHTRAVTSLLAHPRDPFLFLSSSMDGYVKIFSLQIYDEIYSISVFADGIKWMNFQSPFALYCASLSTVKVFDINHICSFWSTVRSPVHNIDLYPKLAGKTSHIVVQDADKCIRIYNRRSGNKLCTVLPPPETFFENGMPSYSYDKVGKIIYILFKETDLWIYLTRTDPATRVNVWNIQNILESKVSDIKNGDESNDLDDFGIGLFRKREAKEDVICLCTETISRDVFQMNPLADLTQPSFDLLMCGMSNGKVYFLDPSPPLSVNLGFVAHTNCPVVDLKTLYDSLTSSVRILSLIKTSSNLCVKIWNANDFTLFGNIDISTDVTTYAVKSSIFVCGNNYGYLRVESLNGEEGEYSEMEENDSSICHHIGSIISVDILPSKKLICSCGKEDFYVRVWNFQKDLLAEIRFDKTLTYSAFLDKTGSLLIGLQTHLYSISYDVLYDDDIEDEEDEKENEENISDVSSGEESIVYEDPQMKRNYNRRFEFETKDLENYLIPYPYLLLEENWMYQTEIMDETDSPDVVMEDEKSRSCTPSSVYADIDIFSETSCSSISDSEFAGVEMPYCGDSPECEEMKSFHEKEVPADEQVAQQEQEYILPITTLHNKRSDVGSTLLIKPSQKQPSNSTINIREKLTQNNLHKPKEKNVRSKSPRKSPAPPKTRKVRKKGKRAVNSDSSEEEEEDEEGEEEEEEENVERIESGGRQSPDDLVSQNKSGDSVVKSSTVESVLKMSSGETVVDSSSGELIVFLSSSDETMEGMTSGETFTEGSIPCYTSEEGGTTAMSVSSPGVPDITNTTPNGTTDAVVEVKSQQSQLIRQIPSIVVITATPEMSSDASSEYVPQEQPVTNVTINRMTSEESYAEMVPEVSVTERKYSSSSHNSSIVEEKKSESSNTTNSCAQVLSHNVSDASHSSYDLDRNEWDGSGFISMTPSGRHYTKNESLFRVKDEDGTYYNMRSEESMRKNPVASNSTPLYPLNKVEVKLGAFSEHCKRCPTSCRDIELHLEEDLKRQSTQETVKCTSFPIPDSEIVLTSISSHDRASLQSVKKNVDITPKESVKKVEQSKLVVKKTPGRVATKSREQVMLVNRVKRQSIQYNSQKDLLLNKSVLDDSSNSNEVSLINEEIDNKNEDKKKNEVHTINSEKVEKNQSCFNKIIESSESSEFEQMTNSDISKSKETIKSSISHDNSVVADDLNDFLFKVNVTRPRQKHFPQLEPIKKADLMKLNSIYTKQLRDTLKKTSKFQEEQKKKRVEEMNRKKKEEDLLMLKEVDEKNEDEELTSDSMEMTVDQPYADVTIRGRGITKKMIPGSFYYEQKQPFNSYVNSDDEEDLIDENVILHEKSYRGKQCQKLSETTSERVLYKLAMDDPDFHGTIKEDDEQPLSIGQSQKTSIHLLGRASEEKKEHFEMDSIRSTKFDISKNEKVSKDLFTEIQEKDLDRNRENTQILDQNRAFSKPKNSLEKLNIRNGEKKDGTYLSAPNTYDHEKNLMDSLSVSSLQIPARQLNENDNIRNMNTVNNKDSHERKCSHHNIDEIENSLKIVSISNKYYNHNIDSLTEEFFDIKREEAAKKKNERREVPVSDLYEFCSIPPRKTPVSPTLMDYYFKGKCRRTPPVKFRSNSRGLHSCPPNNSPDSLSSPFSDNTYSNKMYVNTYVKESRLSSGYGTNSPCSNNSEKSKKRLTIKASPIYHGYLSDNVNRCHSKSTGSEKTSVLLSKDERLAKAKRLETKLSGQNHRL